MGQGRAIRPVSLAALHLLLNVLFRNDPRRVWRDIQNDGGALSKLGINLITKRSSILKGISWNPKPLVRERKIGLGDGKDATAVWQEHIGAAAIPALWTAAGG